MHEETRFHITPYLRKQMDAHPPRLAFSATDPETWRTWRRELRRKLHDLLAPWPYTEPTLARLREVYRVAGAKDDLIINVYDGYHRYYGDGVVEFWNRYL
jgi:hypothetical protein